MKCELCDGNGGREVGIFTDDKMFLCDDCISKNFNSTFNIKYYLKIRTRVYRRRTLKNLLEI